MKLNFKEFFLKLEELNFPIYFFTGPELYLKLRAKDRLLARKDFSGFSKTKLEGAGLDCQALWDLLNSCGLFASGEVIVVDKVDRISPSNKKSIMEILEKWEEMLAQPFSKVLIFVSQSQHQDVSDPLEGHLIASSQACHVYFPVLTEAEAFSWAKGELRRKNIEVSQKLLDRMASVCFNDLYVWANLIRNLELYSSDPSEAKLAADVSKKPPPYQGGPLASGQIRKIDEGVLQKFLGDFLPKEESLVEDMRNLILRGLRHISPCGFVFNEINKAAEKLLSSSAQPENASALRILRIFADTICEIGATKAGVSLGRRRERFHFTPDIEQAADLCSWQMLRAFYGVLIEGEKSMKTGKLPPVAALKKFLSDFWEVFLETSQKPVRT